MKKVKISFDQAEKAISLSETWFDLGNGLYATKVDPKETKCFFKSSRAAGRNFIMVDTAAKNITLTDTLKGLDGFNAVDANTVKKAAGLVEAAEKPAAEAEEKKPVKASLEEKPAQKPAQPQQAGLHFGPALVADKAGKITIASLLNAGKAFASRTVPADFSSRLKKYSEDNRLLLYLQGGPDLGQVSTYRGWLKQGRQVTKGQHGLKILAPRMVVKEDGTKAIDGLRLVTLFSVDQTELASREA